MDNRPVVYTESLRPVFDLAEFRTIWPGATIAFPYFLMPSRATSAPQSAQRVLSGESSLIEGQILSGILYQLLEGLRSLLILIYRSSRIDLTFSHSNSLSNQIYQLLVQSTRTYTKHVHGRTHYGWQGLTPRLCAETRG